MNKKMYSLNTLKTYYMYDFYEIVKKQSAQIKIN